MLLIFAALTSSTAGQGLTATGRLLIPGSTLAVGVNYELSASGVTAVGRTPSGNDLLAMTLTLSNVSGDSSLDISGIEASFGSGGGLHNEQIVHGFIDFRAVTADDWIRGGVSVSAVDSYFIQAVDSAVVAPAEGDITAETGVLDALAGGVDSRRRFWRRSDGRVHLRGAAAER